MKQLPKFSSEKEFIDWIDTHDTSEYMDSWKDVTEEFELQHTPDEEPVGVSLNRQDLEALKRVAKTKGVPYTTLIKNWLIERLHKEASQL